MILDPARTLAGLVAIPSVNPMGRPISDPPMLEGRLTEHLGRLAGRLGLETARQPVAPGRENLLARLDGEVPPERGGRIVLLDAHQDTVPADRISIDPFRPQVREGRLYGRGACDTKGGMAAMLAAVSRLAEERPKDLPTIVLSFTVNEENGFDGVRALCSLWRAGRTDGDGGGEARRPDALRAEDASQAGRDPLVRLLPRPPDAAIVAEPTELEVVVAHKGVVRWRCHTAGRACHSAEPQAGENAIYRMARVLAAIERYAGWLTGGAAHPLCGPPTLSVGTIQGGVGVNTVPDRCTIEIDRRLVPGESPEAGREELIGQLAEVEPFGFRVEHEPPFMAGLALAEGPNGPLARRLCRAVEAVAGVCRTGGVAYASNAGFLAAADVPVVVFGPGSIRQAHTDDEWVSLDQVGQAAEVFYRFCRDFGA